jgi:hypothetical protein
MSVLVEAINVIVRIETLEQKYPGGAEAYQKNCPNKTFCADEYLTRVGFMSPVDVQKFVDALVALGFVFDDGEKFVDVAVVHQAYGLTARCDWLEVGTFPEGWSGCWLKGTDDVATAIPQGRTPESLRDDGMRFVPEEDFKNYEFVGYQGVLTVLRNKETGELCYVPRSRDNEGRTAEEWH